MKSFKNCCAQGDIYIRRIESLPKDVKEVKPVKGKHVVAHSETGHDHVINARPEVKFFTSGDPMVSYLEVIEATDKTEVVLEHMRSFDTHESIKIPNGTFEIRRQREYVPEGWRRVED